MKYRILDVSDENYVLEYKPQVKYSFFSPWRSIGKNIGYLNIDEALEVIRKHIEINIEISSLNNKENQK